MSTETKKTVKYTVREVVIYEVEIPPRSAKTILRHGGAPKTTTISQANAIAETSRNRSQHDHTPGTLHHQRGIQLHPQARHPHRPQGRRRRCLSITGDIHATIWREEGGHSWGVAAFDNEWIVDEIQNAFGTLLSQHIGHRIGQLTFTINEEMHYARN